jgi:hypothetical protein
MRENEKYFLVLFTDEAERILSASIFYQLLSFYISREHIRSAQKAL